VRSSKAGSSNSQSHPSPTNTFLIHLPDAKCVHRSAARVGLLLGSSQAAAAPNAAFLHLSLRYLPDLLCKSEARRYGGQVFFGVGGLAPMLSRHLGTPAQPPSNAGQSVRQDSCQRTGLIMRYRLLLLLLLSPLLFADDQAKKVQRLEKVTWNPVTHVLSWEITEGYIDVHGQYEPERVVGSFSIEPQSAMMTVAGQETGVHASRRRSPARDLRFSFPLSDVEHTLVARARAERTAEKCLRSSTEVNFGFRNGCQREQAAERATAGRRANLV